MNFSKLDEDFDGTFNYIAPCLKKIVYKGHIFMMTKEIQ
jgi:hypothetical protein